MRKISKTRGANQQGYAVDVELSDGRPRRIPGGTVTSWPGPIDLDLRVLLANPKDGATIGGASKVAAIPLTDAYEDNTTVALSDGTRITFITAGQLKVVESV